LDSISVNSRSQSRERQREHKIACCNISTLTDGCSEPCAQVHAASPRRAWQPERRGGDQAEIRRPASAGSDGDGDEDDVAPASAAQAAQEVLTACGRATSGSLDDVAGLHDIKQLLREARARSHRLRPLAASTDAHDSWPAFPAERFSPHSIAVPTLCWGIMPALGPLMTWRWVFPLMQSTSVAGCATAVALPNALHRPAERRTCGPLARRPW